MDIGLWLRVLNRFKVVVVIGILLGALLALLSIARPDFAGGTPTLSYKTDEVWLSSSTLLVTQEGFPWGRAVLDEMVEVPNSGETPTLVPKYSTGERYTSLAAIYAELAKGDDVQRAVLAELEDGARYDAQVATVPNGGGTLPMVVISGFAASPQQAAGITRKVTDAFLRYLERQQARSSISRDTRADVTVVKQPTKPELYEARSMVRPVFLFLLVVTTFIGLAFVLENLRPRPQPAPAVVPTEPVRVRRSA